MSTVAALKRFSEELSALGMNPQQKRYVEALAAERDALKAALIRAIYNSACTVCSQLPHRADCHIATLLK